MAQTRTHGDYTVGWVCALSKEQTAASAMLDEEHVDLPNPLNDHNAYILGSIGRHNVVIACLPEGEIGTNAAATVATRMTSTFPSIRFGLMVGIGGGVPPKVRLGDVVVSTPADGFGGVVQWDMGKVEQHDTFKRTGALNLPPAVLRTALAKLKTSHEKKGPMISQYLEDLKTNWPMLAAKYTRSKSWEDILFGASYDHVEKKPPDGSHLDDRDADGYDTYEEDEDEEQNECPFCDRTKVVKRKPRDLRVHYGLVASGNQVIKNAIFRDQINTRLGGNVLCFEMEAAGLMNDFPCIVIRGICDYADSHKNKKWQEHASAVAAAFAKELILLVPPQEVEQMPAIKRIESQLEGISTAVKGLGSWQQNQEFQTIIDWLTPVNYALQQNDFIKQQQEGTGEWLLQSIQFQQWLTQSNQTLFCPGIPGAGKTILTSIVIRYLQNKFRNDPTIGIAYIFCNFRQQHEQKATDLILSLLKQLVQAQPFLPKIIQNLYDFHKPKQTYPSPNEIFEILYQFTALYSRIFIIIDALDECQVSYEGRDTFLQQLFNLQTKARLEIRASDSDVQKYLDERLRKFPSGLKDPSLQAEIKVKIAKAVNGMFLLAQLYIDSLACKTTPRAIKLALKELNTMSEEPNNHQKSKALDHAYKQAIERIQGQVPEHRELARQVLFWIACAKRRLTSLELQHAIAVQADESELDRENIADIGLIVSVCAGLVIMDKDSDIIRLVHYTTQEFFQRTWKDWFPDAHSDITKICITYMSFNIFQIGSTLTEEALAERLKTIALYRYAAQNWGYHANQSLMEEESLILDFLESTAKMSACSQAMMYGEFGSYHNETEMTAMHLAAYFGLWRSMSYLLGGLHEIDPKDRYGWTPLSWAARNGHESVVKLLLENNADIESKDKYQGSTPLSWAAENGHEPVVKLLLDKNADIESKNNGGWTPLLWAARNGHEPMVKLLLENNADIESKDDSYGRTPLSWAAENGHEPVVKLLLDKNADIESKDDYDGRTPLSWLRTAMSRW